MPVTLGLDIGSNSVGSAWIDTDTQEIVLGVSVFPAGVDEADQKLGEPKNKARRESRSLRRSLARRAQRKNRLRRVLMDAELLPRDSESLLRLMAVNPWHLRRRALTEQLTPHEFGRALIHLNQRRGALGVETDPDDESDGKVKKAIDHTRSEMSKRKAQTFGQLMADLYDERQQPTPNLGRTYRKSIRNRRDTFEFHADRSLIREEFARLWQEQKSLGGALAVLLTGDLRRQLDNPGEDTTWRHRGEIFGQRRTYWHTGTLGRCDLEPTDHRASFADMHAQEFRVLETVNNIRIQRRDEPIERPLTADERSKVIAALRLQKSGTPATLRKALGIQKKAEKAFYTINVERDPDREINTDWFYREIVHTVFTEERWNSFTDSQKESVNQSILKFDPENADDVTRLENESQRWWHLPPDSAIKLVEAWRKRPRLENRVSFSRRALKNLLPFLRRGLSVTEARQCFAEDVACGATPNQRLRYAHTLSPSLRNLLVGQVGEEAARQLMAGRGSTKADRHYLRKHADPLPPAPMLANPVVRKAIHEVRRHVLAYWRKFGSRPDRIVIELARETKQSERVRSARLTANRAREKERKSIIEEYKLNTLTMNQQRAAIDRVLLCRQQGGICIYSKLDGDSAYPITEETAAQGMDVEIDHIVPLSRSQDNGLNNKVLCLRHANRNKGNQTVREWLTSDQFARLLQRFSDWKTDQPRKWENLNRDAPKLDDFVASQLTDTAYAARQVADFLQSALYSDQIDSRQRIFFTNGRYTAQLRRDWQLQDQEGPKVRTDHRHHAIDAAVIALTNPERLHDLARFTSDQERARAQCDRWPHRQPLPPPWGTVDAFRSQVLGAVDAQVVSHRAVKRKIVGALHRETQYGPVFARNEVSETTYTKRIRAESLTPNHLRVPQGWDDMSDSLNSAKLPSERKSLRTTMAALPDRPPASSGIVRDRACRDQIRRCLRSNGVNPDDFGKDAIKRLVRDGRLRMSSGVPINRIILLRTINDPILISRKKWDERLGQYVRDDDPRTIRAYESQNNHHIEIREDEKTGKWSGEVIDTFTAARRVRIDNVPAVDRRDDPDKGGRFVLSLSEGEMIRMRHPETNLPGYFVVFKLKKAGGRIHITYHWDARPAQVQRDADGKEIAASGREDVGRGITPERLRALGPEVQLAPYKVHISPLGEVRQLDRD